MSKIVWVNGCFDVLHRGHLELFKYAKSKGQKLIVGIDSDNKVRQSKGTTRPINCQEDRKFILQSIRYIDEVIIFDTHQDLKELIKKYNPIMVIGSDWKGKEVIGEEYSTELCFFDRISGYSTTDTLRKLNG
jgi:D-glycero-beta-D-manno-heptose 1-phosphate adenylyltransferase|tara:strand:- start:1896 stop:2291 length:396 start_codon:yes stop_codon:yes gene_type:complete